MEYLLRTGEPKRQKKHMIWPRKPLEANFAPTSASSGFRRKTRYVESVLRFVSVA
jgi:hypothetical protein